MRILENIFFGFSLIQLEINAQSSIKLGTTPIYLHLPLFCMLMTRPFSSHDFFEKIPEIKFLINNTYEYDDDDDDGGMESFLWSSAAAASYYGNLMPKICVVWSG